MAVPEVPLPIPPDMAQWQIDQMRVMDGEWREDPDYLCRQCGSVAYLNPYTNDIWGCKKCQYSTRSVFVYFKPCLCLHDLVVRFMWFAQQKGITSFPTFMDRRWQELLWQVREKFGDLLPQSTVIEADWDGEYPKIRGRNEISFSLQFVATTYRFDQRMKLREGPWAKSLAHGFRELAEKMFALAELQPDFLRQ